MTARRIMVQGTGCKGPGARDRVQETGCKGLAEALPEPRLRQYCRATWDQSPIDQRRFRRLSSLGGGAMQLLAYL